MHLLTTERLRFRELNEDDFSNVLNYLKSPGAGEFLFLPENLEKHAHLWVTKNIARYQNKKTGLYVVEDKSTGSFLGQCGLIWQEVEGKEYLEIGYHFLPENWGKGFASEAAQASKRYAFEKNMAPYVVSLIHPFNLPSQKVAIRNEMLPWKNVTFKGFPSIMYRVDQSA